MAGLPGAGTGAAAPITSKAQCQPASLMIAGHHNGGVFRMVLIKRIGNVDGLIKGDRIIDRRHGIIGMTALACSA